MHNVLTTWPLIANSSCPMPFALRALSMHALRPRLFAEGRRFQPRHLEAPVVKVRFAPSPTGNLHVGNTRTAILNYLFARSQGGTLTLRIEDTDLERSDARYETSIMDDLKWLGITWDDGPYRQSERTELYRNFANNLLAKGAAYKCFCPKEKLEDTRQASLEKGEPPRYDGTCRDLSPEKAESMEREGRPYVVRFKAPRKTITFKDGIRGQVQFPPDHVDDFVLLKQELTPSYNFAAAVDDMVMGITHVIRGGDHVSNTPKQIMLFEAFGKKPPKYAHHSLLVGPDRRPLSKRHGATRVGEFRNMGILESALLNYIAVIGRSVKQEIMDEKELIETFSLKSFSSSDSLFDAAKLLWFNKEHMRRMPLEDLIARAGLGTEFNKQAALLRENAATLTEMKEFLDIFEGTQIIADGVAYLSQIAGLSSITDEVRTALADEKDAPFKRVAERVRDRVADLGKKELFMVLRILFTGRTSGPPLKEVFPLIPRDHILKRIEWLNLRLSLP